MTRRTIGLILTLALLMSLAVAILVALPASESQTPAKVPRIEVLLSGASTPALTHHQAGAGG